MITFDEPVLTADEENLLAREIEAGVFARMALETRKLPSGASVDDLLAVLRAGDLAHKRFVSANLRLVTLVANPIAVRAALDLDDLFQEGVLGLLEAVRRFDHARGARFATFALPWIRMRVGESALTRCGQVGLPASRARQRVQVLAIRDALALDLGRTPTNAEIAQRADYSVAVVGQLLAYAPPVRLAEFDPAHDDPGVESASINPLAMRRLVRGLPADERRVIVRLYGLAPHPSPRNYAETAADLGVSTSTVRRRERSALERLRGRPELLDVA